jgi:transcriptional regulator with XRE-family HTH domain
VPSISVGSLGEYIREQREQAEVSLRQLARTAGVSNPYLSQVERGLKRPSAEILQQIAQGLRISAETLYVRAGLLEERDGERVPTVTAAVTADTELTQRQKRALLDVYEAFRRENDAAAATAVNGTGSADAAPPRTNAPRTKTPRTKTTRTKAPRTTAATARTRTRSTAPRED